MKIQRMFKNSPLSILVFFMVLHLASCKKDSIDHQSDFQKSYKEWIKFKNKHQNTYAYTVVWSSWTGMSWQTTITVSHGSVIKRSYKATVPPSFQPRPHLEYTEEGNEIGFHEFGAEPITLDEVYFRAESQWLKMRHNATTYFEAENDGLISSCGYVEDGCADDCFVGITISSVVPL